MSASEKAREAKREYQREWHKKNPGKHKEYSDRYWEKKALEMESVRQNAELEEKAINLYAVV